MPGWAASAGPDLAWRGKVLAELAGQFMQPSQLPPLPVVPHVDLQRYLGTWYEIARMPAPFEKDLVGVTTMEWGQYVGEEIPRSGSSAHGWYPPLKSVFRCPSKGQKRVEFALVEKDAKGQ